jgi:membrane protease YdiL (CAAX protease family)
MNKIFQLSNRPLLVYFLISFSIVWASAGIISFSGIDYGSLSSTLIVAFICMPAPAFAAFIVQKYFRNESLRNLEITYIHADKQALAMNLLWISLFIAFFFFWIFLGGNLLHWDLMGNVDLSYSGMIDKLEEMSEYTIDLSDKSIPQPILVIGIVLIVGFISGCTINLLFTLGEEIGWRGFLYKQWLHLDFNVRVILTGIIWGLWHAPLILLGHNYDHYPVIGIGMMVLFCISLSYPMEWIRQQSKSVLGPAIFHGSINAVAGLSIIFCKDGNELIGSIPGLAGVLSGLSLFGVMFLIKKPV